MKPLIVLAGCLAALGFSAVPLQVRPALLLSPRDGAWADFDARVEYRFVASRYR